MHAHNHYPEFLWENESRVTLVENLDGQTGTHSQDMFANEALAFIRRNKENLFFLYLPLAIPHAELLVEEEAIEAYPDFPEVPFGGRGNCRQQDRPLAAFAAMITKMDSDIGRILDLLDELDLDENTLVMFSSDNGPPREGGADPEFFQSSGGLRGIKRDLYEGGIRVPCIARWPGTIEAGSVRDQCGRMAKGRAPGRPFFALRESSDGRWT